MSTFFNSGVFLGDVTTYYNCHRGFLPYCSGIQKSFRWVFHCHFYMHPKWSPWELFWHQVKGPFGRDQISLLDARHTLRLEKIHWNCEKLLSMARVLREDTYFFSLLESILVYHCTSILHWVAGNPRLDPPRCTHPNSNHVRSSKFPGRCSCTSMILLGMIRRYLRAQISWDLQ